MGLVTATAGVEDWTGNGPSHSLATAGVEDWTGNGPSHYYRQKQCRTVGK